jgi:hypothetical protein
VASFYLSCSIDIEAQTAPNVQSESTLNTTALPVVHVPNVLERNTAQLYTVYDLLVLSLFYYYIQF